jgi:DNA-binding transcriptional LysR family regulator
MDWDKLKVFHAAAEAGSFTHAGEQLGLSQSAVSRQVSALEQELNVPLFHRHARGLILTEQGDLLYRTAHDVFIKLSGSLGSCIIVGNPQSRQCQVGSGLWAIFSAMR